jgi:sortase A
VVEGVSHDDLKKGPGHFPGTDLPGQLGNVVISGHRTTYGAPFNRLDELHTGDAIVLETRTTFFTYTVQRIFVVKPSAIGVTYHVPDHPGLAPTQRLLTLTTCNPKYSARTRLIVRAVLSSTLKKGPGVVPPALRTVT